MIVDSPALDYDRTVNPSNKMNFDSSTIKFYINRFYVTKDFFSFILL